MAKTASITTSLTSASLYTNNRSRRTLFLVGSHSTYVKKLSSVWTFEFSGLVQLFSMMAPFASKKLKCPLSMTLCDWSRDFPLFLITSSTIVIILAQWSITHWVKLTEGIDSLKNGIAVSVQVVMTLFTSPLARASSATSGLTPQVCFYSRGKMWQQFPLPTEQCLLHVLYAQVRVSFSPGSV